MSRIPYDKPPITYAEQLDLLKERGLNIEDDPKTLYLLEVISYYRLSGYWYPLLEKKEKHIFKPDESFETAFNLYKFDRELRLLVLRELEKIEVSVRAKMSYILSHNNDAFWFMDSANFNDPIKYNATLAKIRLEYSRSDEQFITKFRSKYNNILPPSWMMLEVSSFGNLSFLYSGLVPGRNKRNIALYYGVNDRTLSSWLHSMVYLRNVCAHHSRMWNRVMSISPIVPRRTANQWLVNSARNNRSYFMLSMIIYLMNTINPKHTIIKKIKSLLEKYSCVDTMAMGFPNEWEDEPLWKE